VLVGIIVVKVVPTFSEFYSSFGAQLPLSTRVIVAVSDFVRVQLWPLLRPSWSGVRLFGVDPRPGQRARFDRLVLRLPGVGPSMHKFATSQLARTLATLLAAASHW